MTAPCRLLLIEDDHDEAAMIEAECCPDPSSAAFDVVHNATEAEDLLFETEYDLIICDLALPSDARLFDPDTSEGLRLFNVIRTQSQGTPVIVLSGHAETRMMKGLFEANRDGDLYGTLTEQPLVQFYDKENLDDCLDAIRTHIARTVQLDQFEIAAPASTELSLSDQRALRIYGKGTGAARGRVEPLDGGLSDSKTLRLSLIDTAGSAAGVVVAKLGALRNVLREADRYHQVAARLPVGLGAHVLHVVRAGAGRRGALIYQLADEHTTSLFGLLADQNPLAVKATNRLRERMEPWFVDAPTVVRSLSEIRRPLISDLKLQESGHAMLDERTVDIAVRESMAHADLHGLNILVTPAGEPTLIDYGEVRRANAALDPVTLELSAVFHPAMAGALGGWPSEDQAARWSDLDDYCSGSPIEKFVRTCREWAVSVSAGREEVLATAYAYAIRQVKYQSDALPLALSVARGVSALLLP